MVGKVIQFQDYKHKLVKNAELAKRMNDVKAADRMLDMARRLGWWSAHHRSKV